MLKPEQLAEALVILKSLELFKDCPEAALSALASKLEFRELAKDKVVLMDQEIGQTLFILARGQVGVWKRIGGGKNRLAGLTAPDFAGERTMFEDSPASAMVKTEVPSAFYLLTRKSFDETVQTFPAVKETVQKNVQTVRAKRMNPAPQA